MKQRQKDARYLKAYNKSNTQRSQEIARRTDKGMVLHWSKGWIKKPSNKYQA